MNTAVIDRILDAYIAVGDAAVVAIRPDVMFVLVTLAVIGMTWAHLSNAITQRQNSVSLLVFQFMTVGFFVWLLDNWTMLMKALMGGMIQLGLKAGGMGMTPQQFIHPSHIAAAGVRIAAPMIESVGAWGWLTGTNIIMAICMVIVIFAFFILSIQVLVAILEFKLGVVWCFFMVALGVYSKTSFASEKALGYVFASGVKLFALATIVSVGSVLMLTLGTFADPSAPTYGEALGVAFGAMVLAGLAWFVPAKVAGVVSGGPSLGAGAAVGTMAALGATAAVAGVGGVAAAKAASSGTAALRAATAGGGAPRGGLGLPPSGGPGGGGGMRAANSNPVASVRALEGMNRIESTAAAARARGVSSETVEGMRADGYRSLAMESAASVALKNPEAGNMAADAIAAGDNTRTFAKSDGLTKAQAAEQAAETYRHAAIRTLNLDGAGGFDRPELATGTSPEATKQNAALAESLGVGSDIRAMAAKGHSTRQIAEGLGDRLSPVNRMAERIGQGGDANLHRMSVVQAYKDENGIPNQGSAGFKSWASAEKKAQSAAARSPSSQPAQSQAPAWARNSSYNGPGALMKMPANLNAMVPRGAEKSAGMNANNTGAQD